MKTYSCDKCGAEFTLADEEFDDTCPECFSDKTVLLTDKDYLDGDFTDDDDDY